MQSSFRRDTLVIVSIRSEGDWLGIARALIDCHYQLTYCRLEQGGKVISLVEAPEFLGDTSFLLSGKNKLIFCELTLSQMLRIPYHPRYLHQIMCK
jgi:hypothetical protein